LGVIAVIVDAARDANGPHHGVGVGPDASGVFDNPFRRARYFEAAEFAEAGGVDVAVVSKAEVSRVTEVEFGNNDFRAEPGEESRFDSSRRG
jgi:hypothetical protein